MESLSHKIEELKNSPEYCSYLAVREAVLYMIKEATGESKQPSDYWKEEITGFDYLFDASPLIIHKLREHCYHVTGLHSYDYRKHHQHRRAGFARKLAALQKIDTGDLFIPESPSLGGFGYEINGALVNLDTLKFYETLIALYRANLLKKYKSNGEGRKIVLEVGGGWGGLAYQFKSLFPNICYVIIDLPQTLLFSGTYIKTLFPQSAIYFYPQEPIEVLLKNISDYDFVFLPHYCIESIRSIRLDLAINTVSFQEMSSNQVEEYVQAIHSSGCPAIYSLNRDRSPHNSQLSRVRIILEKYYDLIQINILNVPYTSMLPKGTMETIKHILKSVTQQAGAPIVGESIYDYRHIVGSRKTIAR